MRHAWPGGTGHHVPADIVRHCAGEWSFGRVHDRPRARSCVRIAPFTSRALNVTVDLTICLNSLSIPHDEDVKCNPYRREGEQTKIMSRQLGEDVHPWLWSECSRHYVTEFLENNHGLCMLNLPDRDIAETAISGGVDGQHELLAGEKFTATDQCRLIYGAQSKVCSFKVGGKNNFVCKHM